MNTQEEIIKMKQSIQRIEAELQAQLNAKLDKENMRKQVEKFF